MSISIQRKLSTVRSPRVKITFDVESGNAIQKKELPFVFGILADLSAQNKDKPDIKNRKFVEIDGDNFDDVIASYNPFLIFSAKNVITNVGTIKINLQIKSINDLSPSAMIKLVPELSDLYNARVHIKDLMVKLDSNEVLDDILRESLINKKLPDIKGIIESSKIVSLDGTGEYEASILQTFDKFLSQATDLNEKDPYVYTHGLIAQIDELLSKQMDEILHNPEFLEFEGLLRGLHYFISNTSICSSLKIKVLNISKDELLKDLEKSIEFDQSQIFKKVYEEEYGTFGGIPYSCLIGAYDFSCSGQDIELLRKMSGIAAAAHVPFISSANSKMFGLNHFRDISVPRDLEKLFDSSDFAKWNGFRESEDARYVTLVLPRVMIRDVYSPESIKVEEFNYFETVAGDDDEKFCWANAAFCLAQRIGEAFTLYGWTAAIRGFEGGGIVEDLPCYKYLSKDGDKVLKCPTEVSITDRRERELSKLGFLPLCYKKGTDVAVFFGSQTSQKPKQYFDPNANANASISARLPYILNVCRFAHYVKIMMREKIGTFSNRENLRIYLQNWIANYVLLNDGAPQDIKAQYPLREGRVDVVDNPASPGEYKAIFFLRPHFQMEELTVSLRLVAKLPKAQ